MTRRTLFKFLALIPLVGPTIAKAMIKSNSKPAIAYQPYLPECFPKWDRAVDGLEPAGQWAIEIERSRLPADVVFPRVGQVWETVRDCEVALRPFVSGQLPLISKSAFIMLGGTARLHAGERVRILGLEHPDKPLQVRFQPLRCAELGSGIVPDEIRLQPGYSGYELSVKTAKTIPDFGKDAPQVYFNEAFRLIEDVA